MIISPFRTPIKGVQQPAFLSSNCPASPLLYELAGELNQFVVSSGATRAAEDGYLARLVQQVRQDVEVVVGFG